MFVKLLVFALNSDTNLNESPFYARYKVSPLIESKFRLNSTMIKLQHHQLHPQHRKMLNTSSIKRAFAVACVVTVIYLCVVFRTELIEPVKLITNDKTLQNIEATSEIVINEGDEIYDLNSLPFIEFCKLCIQHDFDCVVIEPCFMKTFITPLELELLNSRNIVKPTDFECNLTKSGNQLISVAIKSRQQLAKLADELKSKHFSVKTYNDDGGQITNVLIHKTYTLIHLIVLEAQENGHLLIKGIDEDGWTVNSKLLVHRNELSFAQFDQLFDDFETQLVEDPANDVTFQVVASQSLANFLMQRKYSRKIDCDRQLAAQMNKEAKKLLNDAKVTQEMVETLKSSLKMVNELSKQLLIPLWLDGGTLLGKQLVRQQITITAFGQLRCIVASFVLSS